MRLVGAGWAAGEDAASNDGACGLHMDLGFGGDKHDATWPLPAGVEFSARSGTKHHVAVSSWMSACNFNLMPFGLPTGALPCVLTCSRCEYGFTSTHTVLSLYRCSYKETHAMGQVPPVRGTSHLQGMVMLSSWPAQTMI